jgi:hypothetical protein
MNPLPQKESTVTTTSASAKANSTWNQTDISAPIRQAWERFDTAIAQARQFASSVTDATLSSAKANQEAAGQAVNTFAGLAGTTNYDLKGGLNAGFELTKALVENQRQWAESLTDAAGRIRG